ncbi:MAG: T9SS type A sorting domain-containing protein [Bacteroidales bacterium]|nr:T9SS type A sorting domain-containing protein [Bacteroidales bacterium]
MKMLKFLLFLFLFAIVQQTGNAQSIQYGYDNAGNRISRIIVVQKSSELNPSDTLLDKSKQINDEMLAETGQVKVYPNPASDRLHIVLPPNEQSTGEYWLYTTKGVLLETGRLDASDNNLPMVHLSSGLYLLLVRTNEKTEQWKILKK